MIEWGDAEDDELSPAAREYLEQLLSEEGVELDDAAAILPRGSGATELSFAQQRLWFLSQLQPDSAAYNVPAAVRLTGPLDVAALAASLDAVVRRHEVLRTAILTVDGEAVADIAGTALTLPLPVVDLSGLAAGRARSEAEGLVAGEVLRPFDLARAPLLRSTLVVLGPAEHLVLLTLHHIVSDGWSVGVLVREMGAFYEAFRAGRPAPLPPLPIQYADFAAWQRRELAGELFERHLAHWRERLAGAPPVITLPADRPRPAVRSPRGARLPVRLPAALGAAVDALALAQGATPFMSLLAAVAAWLHRHGAGEDLVLGSPIANRTRAELEGLIGFFANTIVLRLDLGGNPSWHDLLAQARAVTLGAYEHQDLPFEKIVEELVPERDLSYNPLFQVLIALQNAPVQALAIAGLTLDDWEIDLPTARFDLAVDLREEPRWQGSVEYAADLFDGTTVARMIGGFERLLAAAVEAPGRPLAEMPLLSITERHQLLTEWNDTAVPQPGEALLPDLFAAQAARTPQRLAVVAGNPRDGERLTYAELAARSSRLASHLRALGVGPDVLVAVFLERSPDLMVSLLAVLEAGGAYLPLEVSHPRDRLSYLLEDSRAPLLLTRKRLLPDLPESSARRVCLDDLPGDAPAGDSARIPPAAENLAYVLYTSGSTGRPKGVAVTHRGLANYLTWAAAVYPAGEGAPVHSPVSFDLTVTSLFLPLLTGGPVVLLPEAEGVAGLAGALAEGSFGLVKLTPAHLELLHQMLPPGRAAACARAFVIGGEALTGEPLAFWREHAPDLRLINEYGPTETVVGCCVHAVRAAGVPAGPVPIGRPIAGTRLQVLDRRMLPAPLGVAGELHIGGAGVCRGYLHRPALTAERFVPDPAGPAGERLYRTGDLVRHLPDGTLEFLGRLDHQVKIRGFRVELGEIEGVLAALPGVREAAVVAREDTPGVRRLIAYMVGDVATDDLRQSLRQRLPGYMMPAVFVTLAALPLTSNGKVDHDALPAPEPMAPEAVRRAPESELEKTIAAIWQELLGAGQMGLDDNFFDRGGHSLLLVQARARLVTALGRDVSMVDFFTYPTVGALARFLARGEDRAAARSADERQLARWSRARGGLEDGAQPPVAIIGMAGRFPGAPDLRSFWELLRDGREAVTFFTDEELIAAGISPAQLASPHYVKAGAVLADTDLFDAAFFDLLPREAELLDPQQRLLLECAVEALERAGYAGTARPVGVFAGSSDSTYWFHNLASHPELEEAVGLFTLNLSNSRDFVATRLSYRLNLAGASLTVQTACSTSLVAVHLACQSLLAGECELALAGGVTVRAPQKLGYVYHPGGIMSPDGHCRAFDARGEGTVGGQGVGLVVLKPLADALADGDPIHAVIKGSALTNDGLQKVGFTAPGLEGQARAIRAAQLRAGVDPESIGYVETHGTATPLGDLVEAAALTRAFRLGTERRGFCALGSVKTNIGHLDAAAGIAGLIKTVLALEHEAIPPSLHFSEPNPQIDFATSPFFVNTELREWPDTGAPRRAGVSSFGLGGTNAHVVLEEAPAVAPSGPSRPWQVLLLSARTPTALERATDDLAAHLEADPGQSLADVAYTLRAGRWSFAHRRAVVAAGREEAAAALRSRDPRRVSTAAPEPGSRSVAFLLPGVGDQYPGIARGLYRDEPVFRREMDLCAELLLPHLGLDLRDALLAGREGEEETAPAAPDLRALLGRGGAGTERDAAARALLQETRVAQPAMFAVGYALARLWISWGVQPQALLGYSLGEYTAACLAGVMDLPDALALVARRARLIGELAPGAMLAVPLCEEETRARLGPELSLAAVNAPSVTVVAGPPEAVAALERQLAAEGRPGRRLQTAQAFHSWMMQPLAGPLLELLRSMPLAPPRVPCLSNVTGTWLTPAQATDPGYWVSHLVSTVRFADAIAELWREPGRILLEMGPGQTLGSLALQQLPAGSADHAVLPSLRHELDRQPDQRFLLQTLGRLWLTGAALDWSGFHGDERRRRVPLPTYPFERQRFWIERAKSAPVPRAVSAAAAATATAATEGRWLVLRDPRGLGARLAQRLEEAGCTVREIEAPAEVDFDRLFPGRGAGHDHFLQVWSPGAPEERSAAGEALARVYLALLDLARALLARREGQGTVEICVIASGVESQDPLPPGKRARLGRLRVLPQEEPGITCRLLEIGAGEIDAELEERLLAELLPEVVVSTRSLAEAIDAIRSRLTAEPTAESTAGPAAGSPMGLRGPRPALPTPWAAPSTATEETLAALWGELLGIEPIGVHDDFFQLGGHSLLGLQVVSRLQARLGVELPLQTLFEAPTVAGLAARVEAALRAGEGGGHVPPLVPLTAARRAGPLPLSFAQQRLWFIDQLEPGRSHYNLPLALRVEGPLDAAALARCLGEIVRRHEALRTVFEAPAGAPVQSIRPATPFELPVVDLSGLPADRREAAALAGTAEETGRPFDLTRDPLLRGVLLRLAGDDHVAALTMHHIASDGWSIGVLVREITALYAAFAGGRPSPLPELPVQYADFAVWQRQWLRDEVLDRQLEYWRERLAGLVPAELPADRPRPPVRSDRGAALPVSLPGPLTEGLRALGRQEDATLFMSLLAAFSVVVRLSTGSDRPVLGTDIANRRRPELEELIGFFVNQLVLSFDLSGDPTFRELLRQVRRDTLEAYMHQDAPFDRLVEMLRLERDVSRTPLFQLKLVLQNAPFERRSLQGLTISGLAVPQQTAKFDLLLNLMETGDGITGSAEYSTDLFEAATIARLLASFATVLRLVVERPDARLGEIAAEIASLEAEEEERREQEKWSRSLARTRRRVLVDQPVS